MKTDSLSTNMDDQSFPAFADQIQLKPHEFISGGNGTATTGMKNRPPVSLKKEKSRGSESNEREDDFFAPENEDNILESLVKEAEAKPTESKKACLPNEQDSPFMTSFLIELVQSIKNTLASIYHVTSFTFEKVEDAETRKHSHTQVREDIKNIDSVLNSLLNFININTPIAKTNTLYTILEEILEANEKQLQEKNIKIIKRCEEDLPETYIHNEQVRFILHSILQYAIFSTFPNGNIGLLMKSLDFHEGIGANKTPPENKGGYVEMVIGFNRGRRLANPSEALSGTPGDQREEAIELILKLVKEILQKNHGRMMLETNGKRPNTLITLRFPVERRNVVYYAPINL